MNNKTALIVDDEKSILFLIESALKRKGYETKAASSADDAKQFLSIQYSLAIIDGLEGKCWDLYPQINAQRKIIFSGNSKITEVAKEKQYESWNKPQDVSKLLDLE